MWGVMVHEDVDIYLFRSSRHHAAQTIIILIFQTRKLRHRDDCDQLKQLVSGSTGIWTPSVCLQSWAFATTPSVSTVITFYLFFSPTELEPLQRQGPVSALPWGVLAVPASMVSGQKEGTKCMHCVLDLTEGRETSKVLPKYQSMCNLLFKKNGMNLCSLGTLTSAQELINNSQLSNNSGTVLRGQEQYLAGDK